MRFYIMTDMEGVSGVVDFDKYTNQDSPYYEKGRRLATLEVNAAIEGILSTGEHEVTVCDGHGQEAIDIELLHKEAVLIMGRPIDLMFEMNDKYYDGFLMIGQHAMESAPKSNLGHTFDHKNIISLSINGILLGEAGVNALRAGIFKIPTVFLSGDRAACQEIRNLIPLIHTCEVKVGIKSTSAVCLQPDKAREKIKESVRNAVINMDKITPYKIDPPYHAVFEFSNPEKLTPYTDKHYCKVMSDCKVLIEADDMKELLEERLWGI